MLLAVCMLLQACETYHFDRSKGSVEAILFHEDAMFVLASSHDYRLMAAENPDVVAFQDFLKSEYKEKHHMRLDLYSSSVWMKNNQVRLTYYAYLRGEAWTEDERAVLENMGFLINSDRFASRKFVWHGYPVVLQNRDELVQAYVLKTPLEMNITHHRREFSVKKGLAVAVALPVAVVAIPVAVGTASVVCLSMDCTK